MSKTETTPEIADDSTATLKWYQKLSWFIVFGAVLIFASWISQNYFKTQWSEQKSELDRFQTAILISEMMATQWELFYLQEASKNSPENSFVGLAAIKHIEANLFLPAWLEKSIVKDEAEYQRKLAILDRIDELSKNLYKEKKFKELMHLSDEAKEKANELQTDLSKTYHARLKQVVEQEKFWSYTFLIAYVVGSFLLGFGYLQNNLKK